MNCLNDYIGLRGCATSVPPSGLWLDDLPGMSLKHVAALTDVEKATYLDVWNMVQRRAQSRFSLDVREAMGKMYKLNSLMQGVNIGNIISGSPVVPLYNQYQGFAIELIESATSQYTPSPLAAIHVQELRFYATGSETGAVFVIKDLSTDATLWTQTLDLVSGWNTIAVNTTFTNNYAVNSWRIFAAVDTSTITTNVSMDLPYGHTIPSCCDVRLRGIGKDAGSDLQFTTDTRGLSGTFSIVCSWDALVCQNLSLFARPYWYLCGIEMLTETIYSSNLNSYTTVNLQRNKELREEYQVEYAKALEQIAGGFKLACDCCIECSGGVQLREATQFY